jgi:hypothetical protein
MTDGRLVHRTHDDSSGEPAPRSYEMASDRGALSGVPVLGGVAAHRRGRAVAPIV